MELFWIQFIFYALLSFYGELEPIKYSDKVQTPPSGTLLIGSIAPGKIKTQINHCTYLTRVSNVKLSGSGSVGRPGITWQLQDVRQQSPL